MKQSTELEKIYRDARTILDKRGWCQHNYEDASGQMCIVAAIRAAQNLSPNPYEDGWRRVSTEAEMELGYLADSECRAGLERLNNFSLQTKEDVLGLLELAADLAAPSP